MTAALMSTMLIGTLVPNEVQAVSKKMYYTIDAANIRSGAGTNNSIVGMVPKGTSLQVVSSKSVGKTIWYAVKYKGKTRWISGALLKVESTKQGGYSTLGKGLTYTTKVSTVFNSGAGNNFTTKKNISKGTKMTATGSRIGTNGVRWYEFTISGKKGYISGKAVTATKATKVLNVAYKSQLVPTYAPYGCEGVSLLMALSYKGYTSTTTKAFLDKMPKSTNNPYSGFASGNPYKTINNVFQSIFPAPLTKYGKTYHKNVANGTNYTATQLKKELDAGNPIVVFVTLDFAKPIMAKWNLGAAGKQTLVDNMHVVTLIGYNKSTGAYYVADPNKKTASSGKYWVSKSRFEAAYNPLKFAVIVR